MQESSFDPIHKWVIAPAVLGFTLALWTTSLLEILTRGGMRSDDNLTGIYLSLMASYVAGIEVEKWLQKEPADPQNDAWVERMQRAGGFLSLWLLLLMGAYLARLHDHSLPMPTALKAIVAGLIPIFMAKRASRHVRHSRRGVGESADVDLEADSAGEEEDDSVEDRLSESLRGAADGLSFQQLAATLAPTSARQVSRALKKLLAARRIVRLGRPHTKDVRYRLTGSADTSVEKLVL